MTPRIHQRGVDHRRSSMGAGQGSGHSKTSLEPPSGSPFGSP